MIRQPLPEERTQIIPLIQTIMEDMELPILKEVSPSTLHTMLEEAMLQEDFRYSLTNTLVYIEDGSVAGAIFGYHGHLEPQIDDPFYQLYEAYNIPTSIRLYEDSETQAGEWYIDILSVHENHRRKGIGMKLLQAVEELAKQQGASVIALNCEEINDKAYQLYQKLGYTATSTKILSGHFYYHMTKKLGVAEMNKEDLSIMKDDEYKKFISILKEKVRSSQLKAAIKVNYELLDLYWNLGKEIVEKQKQYSWGDSFLKVLSSDLKEEFPDIKGFSPTNLKHIRYWFKFYNDFLIGLQAVTQKSDIETKIKSIPWGHNQRIMYKSKDVKEALFYVDKTIENGWSRSVLEHQIDGELYKRLGNAVTNFDNRLPAIQSELAKQTIKDPYNFDFLTIRDKHDERELEEALVNQITSFLLELGTGFSYIGKQVHIKVGESDFYIDLLFYHVKLHSYVVIELKTEKFKPEFVGQLNFYVTAVNKNIKSDSDNQTIGLLICRDKDNIVAEYSLENISQPIGISQYEISKLLDQEFKSSLPSIEEIEASIKKFDSKL